MIASVTSRLATNFVETISMQNLTVKSHRTRFDEPCLRQIFRQLGPLKMVQFWNNKMSVLFLDLEFWWFQNAPLNHESKGYPLTKIIKNR